MNISQGLLSFILPAKEVDDVCESVRYKPPFVLTLLIFILNAVMSHKSRALILHAFPHRRQPHIERLFIVSVWHSLVSWWQQSLKVYLCLVLDELFCPLELLMFPLWRPRHTQSVLDFLHLVLIEEHLLGELRVGYRLLKLQLGTFLRACLRFLCLPNRVCFSARQRHLFLFWAPGCIYTDPSGLELWKSIGQLWLLLFTICLVLILLFHFIDESLRQDAMLLIAVVSGWIHHTSKIN